MKKIIVSLVLCVSFLASSLSFSYASSFDEVASDAAVNSAVSFGLSELASSFNLYRNYRGVPGSFPLASFPAGCTSASDVIVNFTEVSYDFLNNICSSFSTDYVACSKATYSVVSADDLNKFNGSGWQGRNDWYYISCSVIQPFQIELRTNFLQLLNGKFVSFHRYVKGDKFALGNSSGYILVAHSNRPVTNNNNFVVVDNTVTNNNTLVNYDFDLSLDDSAIVDAIDTTNSLLSRAIQAVNNVGDLQYYSNSVLGQFFNLFIQYVDGAFDSFTTQDNILFALQQFYNLFDSRFSDLDLTYFNEADIAVPRGGTLDWNEADQGNISILANDIGTLELSGFPDIDGYWVNHSLGGDISVERNDGTFFPNEWQLSGGTVTMPTIDTYYASISVSAPVGTTIEVAGNTHTFDSADVWSVNVDFGSYAFLASFDDNGTILTCSDTIVVDDYSDYLVTVSVSQHSVSVSYEYPNSNWTYDPSFIGLSVDGAPVDVSSSGSVSGIPVGATITCSASGWTSYREEREEEHILRVYIDGVRKCEYSGENGRSPRSYSFSLDKNYSLTITTSSFYTSHYCFSYQFSFTSVGDPSPGAISDGLSISFNPPIQEPVTTISRLYRPADSTTWVAFDSAGEQHSFTAASNLALNRSFVSHSYSGADLLNLSNFPSGSWTVNWDGDSEYITIHFEEYSKFFLWLNRFLINFRDTLYEKMEDISVTADGDVIVNQSGVDYTEQLDAILESLDSALSTGDYTTIVNEINNYDFSQYSTFTDIYNIDEDTTLIDVTKDGASVFGKLIRFLFDIGVRDALDSDPIGDLADFYLDETEGVDVWAS